MSTNNEDGKDQQKSPSTGPINNMDDLKSRGKEAATARAAVKERPVERFNSLQPALEKAFRDRAAREASVSADPAKEKPTVHDRQLRPEGTKPQPVIQSPGGGARQPRTSPVRTPTPQPATPATATRREPTNADKLFAKIEKSLAERQPIRAPLVKPERSPEKDHER